MKVLLTGASGQLGRALSAGVPQGIELLALDRQGLDISDCAAVDACIQREKPAWVINAAAYTAVDKAESDEAGAAKVNAIGPSCLAAACKSTGARLLHVSTDFVFDGMQGRPYRPDDETSPLGVYGRTKLEGERGVLRESAGTAIVLRTAWVYDAEGRNFVTTMLRLMRERDELGVVQDQVGTPTWSVSLARCCWSLVSRDAAGGVYHWTDAGVASWYDFAVAIMEEAVAAGLLDRPITVRAIQSADYPTPARRPHYSVLDRTATERVGGLRAEHWRTSLRMALRNHEEPKA